MSRRPRARGLDVSSTSGSRIDVSGTSGSTAAATASGSSTSAIDASAKASFAASTSTCDGTSSSAAAAAANAASVPSARASRSRDRSTSGHASSAATAGSCWWPLAPFVGATTTGEAAKAGSAMPAMGAHVRQRPSVGFQQSPHVYCRQVRQKLKVLWKASSWWAVADSSSSPRASAIASESDASSDMTKFLTPLAAIRTRPIRDFRGALDSKV